MQKIIYERDIPKYNQYIEQSVLQYLSEGQFAPCEFFDYYTIICFDWYDIKNSHLEPAQILIYFDTEDMVFFCENDVSFEIAKTYFVEQDENERALYLFFKALFKDHMKNLEDIEDKLESIDDAILLKKLDENMIAQIVNIRHDLYKLKKYYDRFDAVFSTFYENDNELVSEKGLNYFDILHNRVLGFILDVQSMREYNNQIKDFYYSQIESEKNSIMKTFTMITSIFMPLTLIAGWYGMNLKMPETSWKYGYIFVIILNIVVCAIWYAMFKKKKWF